MDKKEQYLRECEQENQKVLQQIWDKLEFPMNSDQVVSIEFRYPWRFASQSPNDEIIIKEGQNFVIRPQDNYRVAYHVSYLNELLSRLHQITEVKIQWKDGKTDRAVAHLNKSTGKVQLQRF